MILHHIQLITIVGIGGSICTATSFLPQLLKILKEKKANDISFGTLIVLFAGLGLWVGYGFLKHDWIIVAANSVSFAINITIMFFTLRYRQHNTSQK